MKFRAYCLYQKEVKWQNLVLQLRFAIRRNEMHEHGFRLLLFTLRL